MLYKSQLLDQVLNIRANVHPTHIEGYLHRLYEDCVPSITSSRQEALLNQYLLECLELDLSTVDFELTGVDKGTENLTAQHLALLPSGIVCKTLTLWSGYIYNKNINNYINKKDITVIKEYFLEHYGWLTRQSSLNDDVSKMPFQDKLQTLPVPKTFLPLDSFLFDHLPQISLLGINILTADWPHVYKKLLTLKLPKKEINTKVNEKIGIVPLNKEDVESTLFICLERISKEWHEKFLPKSA
ncbi:hypothetical protein GCM10007938_16120 [Vibrio zhanjiangensis]|uniref:Uncharacterized protein n=1 Tax=Vibrio zhanjiangensis TaxID=1046128 RepID=A0ABQ6EXX8_9VIBR|nr:hypothetical protein [Vibrio zhanjiangensis]GLT17834.1 hypothetical protein GCM10007938_16120 [Vibrio zhanjiangensis]